MKGWLSSLYVVTGLATGCQLTWLMSWGAWGKPLNPLEPVGLTGAMLAGVAGLAALADTRAGAIVAVVGCDTLWVFYGPALYYTFVSIRSAGLVPAHLVALVPPALLIVSSVVTWVVLCVALVRWRSRRA